MKMTLASLLLFGALQASAQSFLVENDGTLLTIDRKGFLYDLGHSVDPDDVGIRGKNWFDNKGVITTIDMNGLVHAKPEIRLPRLRVSGGHWAIGSRGEFVVFASNGFVYNYDDSLQMFRRGQVLSSGHNWIVLREGSRGPIQLVTVDVIDGRYFVATPESLQQRGLNVRNIRVSGGNWFIDSTGVLHAVTRNGGVMSHPEHGNFMRLVSNGGNFFIDSANMTRVVMDNGLVLLPNLPMAPYYGAFLRTGSQSGWTMNGTFITFAETIDAADERRLGVNAVFQRVLSNVVRMPDNQPDRRGVAIH